MRRFSFSASFGDPNKEVKYHKDVEGKHWTMLWESRIKSDCFKNDKERIKAVLNNPAALRVFKINCDLFSLGKVNQYNPDGSEKEKDFLYSQLKKPNKFQSWTQFFWDYMFWVQCGTAYLYRTNNVITESTQFYFLNPAYIEFDSTIKDKLSKFIFSNVGLSDLIKETVKYTFPDGNTVKIPLKDITPFFDLSNGITPNWYRGASSLDALYHVLKNSERAQLAKGRNLDFSGKFLASGQNDPSDTMKSPLAEDEKNDIETKLMSGKWIHATKSLVKVSRFVENINNLKLDDAFFNDYFTIGAMMGVPKDILEVHINGSTYENQEKATGRHVEYGLKPKGQMFTDFLEHKYNLVDIRMSWSHCMFNQVFEIDRADRQTKQLDNLIKAQSLGMDESEIKRQMDLILTM